MFDSCSAPYEVSYADFGCYPRPPIATLHWGLLMFNPSGCGLPALIINH